MPFTDDQIASIHCSECKSYIPVVDHKPTATLQAHRAEKHADG